tara:strand:- start:348 stop:530 length:183 start_codon:yes stop_codon:yes gene_type:complete
MTQDDDVRVMQMDIENKDLLVRRLALLGIIEGIHYELEAVDESRIVESDDTITIYPETQQ